MKPRHPLLSRILRLSSGATVAAVLLSSPDSAQGSSMLRPLVQSTLAGSRREGLLAPLVLIPADTSDVEFIGHKSHSSHRSHSSHTSGSSHRSHSSHYSGQSGSGRNSGGGSYSAPPQTTPSYGPQQFSNTPPTQTRPSQNTETQMPQQGLMTHPNPKPDPIPEPKPEAPAPKSKPATMDDRYHVVSFDLQVGGLMLATIKDTENDKTFQVGLFDGFDGLVVTSIDPAHDCVILRGKANSSYVLKHQP